MRSVLEYMMMITAFLSVAALIFAFFYLYPIFCLYLVLIFALIYLLAIVLKNICEGKWKVRVRK